ncbi:MAG: YdbL family protein [Terasakiella sp.]|uniref:YdbL family protein n=1 Tax=unclassified Terasakiella TaxID=2614952 RepID=UPI003AFFE23D
MSALVKANRFWKLSVLVILLGGFLLVGMGQAQAQSLDDLRASGQMGEAFDGYARARAQSVKAIVDDINAKRRTIYQDRAKQQGISAAQVGQVYAAKIIEKAPAGTWLLSADGSWRQK